MNIRDLKYIINLASEHNFAKAAKKSFVSQPALSMQIKKLEDELGVKIFERNNKNFLITDIGKEILKKAENIVKDSEEIKNIAKNSKDPFINEVRIGAFPTLAPYFFPNFVNKLHKKFPHLKIFLIEEKSSELNKKLINGDLDCILLANQLDINNIECKKIFCEDFFLATPLNHDFSKRKKISNKEIAGLEMMLLDEGHCLRSQALEFCSTFKIFENTNFRASSLETLKYMIASGNGITLIPKIAIKEDDKINYIKIINAPQRKIYLNWRKSSLKQKLFIEIFNICKNIAF